MPAAHARRAVPDDASPRAFRRRPGWTMGAKIEDVRTPADHYTPSRTLRVYSRDRLLRAEHVHLHRTGIWYVEPAGWRHPHPFQHGYADFAEAIAEAEIAEHIFSTTGGRGLAFARVAIGVIAFAVIAALLNRQIRDE
jgi:hypothetical protein